MRDRRRLLLIVAVVIRIDIIIVAGGKRRVYGLLCQAGSKKQKSAMPSSAVPRATKTFECMRAMKRNCS